MRFRKLRIAFSATCLIACVLLIALWVRSYWYRDARIMYLSGSRWIHVVSMLGQSAWAFADSPWGKPTANQSGDNVLTRAAFTEGEPVEAIPDSIRLPLRDTLLFHWQSYDDGKLLTVPYWLPVFASSAFAIAPWIRWTRRFSLRTLLLATTLVAVVLGVIVWAVR
jgi:hypothetical protein